MIYFPQAHTDLLDSRTLQPVRKIPSRNAGCGIRSVSFKGNILTIGTGIGMPSILSMEPNRYPYNYRVNAILGSQSLQIP